MNNFKNKNYVISGASSGIGFAITNNILQNGGNVLITGKNIKKLNKSYSELKKKFENISILKHGGDLNNENIYKSINVLLKKQKWLKIAGIIANAGKLNTKKNNLKKENIEWYLKNNFFIATQFVQNFLNNYNCNNSSIVFISSIATNLNVNSPFGYSASKLLINHYAKYLSNSLNKKKIRVNTISPGNIYFKNSSWDHKLKNKKKDIINYINNNVPLKRFGSPSEIADLAIYLLSQKSSFVNGTNITCDGGQIKNI